MKLSPKQKDYIENGNARWNLLTGAARGGKSHSSLLNIPRRLKQLPDGRRALIGKTETTIMRNILDPLRDMVGAKYVSEIEGKKREATIFGKKFYCIGANDARSVKKLQGAGLIYVYGDEITTWPEEFFNMLKSRLDKKNSKFDGTCNPEGPYHWLKQDIIDNEKLDVYHQHFTIDDNPFLSDEFVKQLKLEYTGVWYQRYILGKWVLAEGLVYPDFDDNNLYDKLPKIKQEWIAIDYGITNDTVFQHIGLGYDNKLYVMHEYRWGEASSGSAKTDVQLREKLQEFILKYNITPQWIFIDPSAKSFIVELYQHRKQFSQFGRVAKANNEVLDGIRRVSSLVANNRLMINPKLEKLTQEFNSYSWDSKKQEVGEDKPIKEHDHGLDALRYLINGIPRIRKRVLKGGD